MHDLPGLGPTTQENNGGSPLAVVKEEPSCNIVLILLSPVILLILSYMIAHRAQIVWVVFAFS